MKAIFYYNHSDARVLNKDLEWIVELDITFREGESITTPSILLELTFDDNNTLFGVVDSNNEDVVINTDDELLVNVPYSITDFNYCYIPILNRYYYITNVTILTNNLYRFDLSEDVLMSFKDSILVLDAFVTRNEYTFNALVKDDLVSYYYDKNIEYYDLNEGGDTKINTNSNYKTNNISICVINNKRSVVSQAERPTTPSDDNSSPYFWNGGVIAYNNVYCADVEDINGLSKWLVDDNTLASYVLKMTVYPFELKGYGGINHLWLGDTELVASGTLPTINVNELICPQGDFYTICNKIFVPDDNSFLAREPYTKYELYIPYLSYIPIDADKIIGKYIKISYALDYKSGNAQVYVIADNKVIFTSECQLGVDIPVNSTNSLQVQNNKISNAMGLSLGLLGGAVGMFTGNPLAVMGGVLTTTKSVASFINNANTNYNTASGNYASANGGLFGKATPHLRITKYKIKDYNNDYFKLYGKPLNKVVKLNTLNGFTTIDEIHLENIKCNESEKNEIYSLLKNGVIL